ncbi:hypothetical protein [Tychonema sp. BBK16]|nr:hypothetical protein [Tychonema sp. BBK16]MCF6373768.1 hypothetical protein [Tychonema sp. BBK16]
MPSFWVSKLIAIARDDSRSTVTVKLYISSLNYSIKIIAIKIIYAPF